MRVGLKGMISNIVVRKIVFGLVQSMTLLGAWLLRLQIDMIIMLGRFYIF